MGLASISDKAFFRIIVGIVFSMPVIMGFSLYLQGVESRKVEATIGTDRFDYERANKDQKIKHLTKKLQELEEMQAKLNKK